MYTLGINAAFHDSSATIVKDGLVFAAAEEERFTRIKHAKRPIPFSTYELPFFAIDYCLKEAGITLKDVNHIAYDYDPQINLGKLSDKKIINLPERFNMPWRNFPFFKKYRTSYFNLYLYPLSIPILEILWLTKI